MTRKKKPSSPQQILALEEIIDPLVCRRCNNSTWRFSYVVYVDFDVNTNTYSEKKLYDGEKICCAGCGLQTTKANNTALRSLVVFDAAVKVSRT